MVEKPSTNLQSVALKTFSKSCQSYLPGLEATLPVSRMRSRSNNLLASFFRAKRLKKDDHGGKALLVIDDGTNLGHLGPGVAGGDMLHDDGAQKLRSFRSRDELYVAEKALSLPFPKRALFLVEGYFKHARSVEYAAYRRFLYTSLESHLSFAFITDGLISSMCGSAY